MNTNSGLVHWATLLYVIIVLASLPITQGTGGGPPPAGWDPSVLTVAAQVGLILLPALAFVWLTRQPFKETLKLQPLDFRTAAKSFLLGLLCWPVFIFLSTLTQAVMAMLNPGAAAAPGGVGQAGSPWILFLGVVLVAPLCEEILCRGVLLSAYEKRFAVHAVWMVAILFAFLHPDFGQVLGALLVGLVAGWLVYRTRSLWSGVLAHAGANLISGSIALLMSLAAPAAVEEAAGAADVGSLIWIGVLVWGVIGLLMLVPGFFLMRSMARRHPAITWPETGPRLRSAWSFIVAAIGDVAIAFVRLVPGGA